VKAYSILVTVACILGCAEIWRLMPTMSYFGVGLSVMTGALVLMYVRAGFRNNVEAAPLRVWIPATVGVCVIAGLVWPALPILFLLPSTDPTPRRGTTEPSEPGVACVEDSQQHEDRHQAASEPSTKESLLGRNSHQHERRGD
jgi:hypothetical protein